MWWAWTRENCLPPPRLILAPSHLKQVGERPWVLTVEELVLPLTSYRTWECRWYMLSGEHSSADWGSQGDLDLRDWRELTQPSSSAMW